MILSLSPDNRHPYTMSLCTQSKYFKQSHITLTFGILSQISPTVQTISNSLTIILLMFFPTIYSVLLCFWAFFYQFAFFCIFFSRKVLVRIHTISILWISYNFSWFHEIQWNFYFRFWLFAFHEENEHNLENANNFSEFRICMRSITKKP